MITGNRGVRKVNERIVADGRAFIITEKDKDKYQWEDIPLGSKFIDTATGVEMVKLEGESDWVPAGLKNDGTLCIAKDTITIVEVFRILNLDDGDGNFTYSNEKGEYRHMPIMDDGGYVFEVEEGSYQRARNHLEVIIDDVLHRSSGSAYITELNDRRFVLHEELHVGQEITVKYYKQFRIGQPYPRIFIGDDDPSEAEIGDLYVDTNYTRGVYDDDEHQQDLNDVEKLDDIFAKLGHEHTVSEITDFPTSLPANGGVADSATQLTNTRNITLSGFITGSAVFNGTADAMIQTSYNDAQLTQKIKTTVGIDNPVQYIKIKASKVKMISGTLHLDEDLTASDSFMLPIPSGCDRDKCLFTCVPIRMISYPAYVNYTSAGMIIDFQNVTDIAYTVTSIINEDENE